MLFISFLCLLYLMVLTDSRTISKSINNYDNTEDVYDAVTDFYYTTNHKLKHNRHIHKNRFDRNDAAMPIHGRLRAKVTKPHDNAKMYGRDTKIEAKDDKTYSAMNTIKLNEKTTEHLKHKTPKPRVGGLWRKFRNKLKIKHTNEPIKRMIIMDRDLKSNKFDSNTDYLTRTANRKNNKQLIIEKSKSAVKRELNKTNNVALKKWFFDDKDLQKSPTTKMESEYRTRHETIRGRESTPGNVNLTAELDALTTEILQLKQLYSDDKYMTTPMTTPVYEYTQPKTFTMYETEFPGTAQIEELLNDIRSKAIQMIAEQTPSVTDIISNTVTEATFDADPILVRSEIGSPGYAFSTFVSINAVDSNCNKRISDVFEKEFPLENTSTEHAVHLRSIAADAMTIAQNVEEMVQKKLKLMINKVKKKISCEVKNGTHKPKPSTGHHAHLKTKTTPMRLESKMGATFEKRITESTTPRNREDKPKKNSKATHTTDVPTHLTTLDDYVLLTLYEEILSKTRDDNIMRMVTNNDSSLKVKRRNHSLLSKRNLETLTDLKLKEDVQKLYDNSVDMPEYDYSVESSIPEDSTERTDTSNIGTKPTNEQIYDEPRTAAEFEETSYEALSNKIAYNDFVNGYKHYLKFQKEQANTNFSNMVRYQAHRHHSVDDIGKFILNKIPPLPRNRDRRFFDDTDIDDQEISTKSDDSWFKKHFYFFIDNGPPKKYHTSQTVSLKNPAAPTEKPDTASDVKEEDNSISVKIVPSKVDESTEEMNLDDLSKTLEGYKNEEAHSLMPHEPLPDVSTPTNILDSNADDTYKTFAPKNFIEKMFGNEKRQTHKPKNSILTDMPDKQLNETSRFRRDARSVDFEGDSMTNEDNEFSNDEAGLHDKLSDPKHGYVNINVVPQPTAIVKLRDNTTKQSRIGRFFNKFSLHKKRKESKKVKRNSPKQKRFNPIKKLKNMFNVKPDQKPATTNFDLNDNEMTTSHVDGFKSIKYDKPMNLDDMLKQIPNITGFSEDVLVKPPLAHSLLKIPNNDMKWMYAYNFSDNQLIDHYGTKYNESGKVIFDNDGINYSEFDTATTNNNYGITTNNYAVGSYEPINNFMPDKAYTTRPAKHRTTTKRTTLKTTAANFPMTNTKSYTPSSEQNFKFPVTESTRLMTWEDMNNEIEKIQSKLFHYRKLEPFSLSGNELFARVNTKTSTMPVRRFTSYGKDRLTKEHLVEIGHYKKPTLMHSENTTLIPYSRDQIKHLVSSLTPKPDIKIKGEMTRVIKFPMAMYKKEAFIKKYNDISEDYVGVEEPAVVYKSHNENRGTTLNEPIVKVTVTELMSKPTQINEPDRSHKLNSDYFNDLLLWHDDILSADRVTNPSWKKIIDSLNENNYTTPNAIKLASEVSEINDYLQVTGNGKETKKYNDLQIRNVGTSQNNGFIKTLAINDKTLGESEGIVVEGEAKYYKFNKPVKFSVTDERRDHLEYLYDDNGKGVDYRRNTGQTEEPTDILVNTTLLAYDDNMMNMLDDISAKKITRNTATANVKVNPYQPVLAKTNKQPEQYFSTPLPMKSNEFERFLKQNSIDVESVTSPINEPPSYLVTLDHKSHASPINSFKTDRVPEVKDNKRIGQLFKSSKEPHYKSKGITKSDMRLKRYREINVFPNMKEKARQRKYYNKIKKKLFDTQYTTEKNKFYARSTLNNEEDKEVEITIINLDDMKKTPLKNSRISPAKSTRNLPVTSDDIYESAKPKFDDNFAHNKLLYNFDKYGKTDMPKVVVYTPQITNTDNEYQNDMDSNNLEVMSNPDDVSHLFNNKHPPKRVHISGHSYQYDIFYGQDKRGKTTMYYHDNFGNIEQNTPLTMLPDTASSLEPPLKYLRGLTNNSDHEEEARRTKGLKKYDMKHRKARTAETYTSEAPALGSVIYNLKSIEPSKRESPNDYRGREKRLFKILPLLQDKIKSIRKHPSTTGKPEQTNIKEHKTSILDTTTITEAVTKKKTTKSTTKYKKLDDSRKQKWVKDTDAVGCEKDEIYNDNSGQQQVNSELDILATPDSTPKLGKRDVQTKNTFTAKDVAALEIIVDLMKNNINCEDKDISNTFSKTYLRCTDTTKSDIHNRDSLNSIEVHIAIPYELQNSKRSLDFEPVRVRKVFSAKMSTPVDLEYQVNSYEGVVSTEPTPSSIEDISPGMYLLVNKSGPKGGILLKPVPASIKEALKQKELPIENAHHDKVETTSTNTNKDGVRVTLSKDFLAAVNKQIFELLGNGTLPSRKVRDTNGNKLRKMKEVDQQKKSLINWEAVKKFFGHDRVCHCKCKPYKAMCRACAASDAVISELIFEFDNLAEYMKEHCTEIQTFFWMNPTGGKKLRDAVHRIDTSMKDYYKRVKGKCQGRTCKTFCTFIDKREYKKSQDVNQDVGRTFLDNLVLLVDDVDKTTKMVTCYDKKLKDKTDQLIQMVNNCLNGKSLYKRQDSAKRKVVKTVYSLDNINVNIICNPGNSPSTEKYDFASFISLETTPIIPPNILNTLDMSLRDIKKYNKKKHKGFKSLFTKKHKLFTYYVTDDKLHLKKRAANQIEAPLISDSGGAFWYDYIKGKTSEPRIVKETKNIKEPKVGITVIQSKSHKENKTTSSNTDNNSYITILTSPKTVVTRDITVLDLLSNNINQLLKLLSNEDVEEAAPYHTISNFTTTTTTTTKSDVKTDTTKTKKPKKVIPTKPMKQMKEKCCKNKVNNTTTKSGTEKMKNVSVTFPITMKTTYDLTSPIATEALVKTTKPTVKHTCTTKGIIKKIIQKLTKGNYIIDEEKLTTVKDRKRYTSVYSDVNETISTQDKAHYPTIVIINEATSVPDKNNDEYNNLLLSIIQHETNNLNDEWLKFAYKNVRDSAKEISKPSNIDKSTKPILDKTNSEIDYDILKSLDNLQLPERKEYTKSNRLLDRLANKIGIKVPSGNSNKKAGKERIGVVTRELEISTIAAPGVKDIKQPKEACDTSRQICDIQATYDHIVDLYEKQPAQNFENYIRNVTCFKRRPAKKLFYIEYPNKVTKWDWIRRRRDSRHTFGRDEEVHGRVVTGIHMNEETFEKFVKGDDGIYRIRSREKRTASDLKDLYLELKNIAPLNPAENEVYAMVGDTITFDCHPAKPRLKTAHDEYSWNAERNDMLLHENVMVEGSKITITGAGARNDGLYSCNRGDSVRNFKVSVVAPPDYSVVFAPSYSSGAHCGDYELKAVQQLGPAMCKEMSCGSLCTARIDEPVCRRARGSNKYNVKVTAVLGIALDPGLECSVQCRRDLASSLTMLVAQNVPTLSKIGVFIKTDGMNKTLLPSRSDQKSLITHTLKKKDSNGHQEYHRLASNLAPGVVDVVLACPGGFYLIHEQKICVACPANTNSSAGDNVCCPSPHRSRAVPRQLRRYDWWWYPPCGYLVASGGVLCACCGCVALAVLAHVTSPPRARVEPPAATTSAARGDDACKEPTLSPRSPHARPLSPSRVILARFFKPSLTSSRASDSQETKFELWKKTIPPPLPPIDFDI